MFPWLLCSDFVNLKNSLIQDICTVSYWLTPVHAHPQICWCISCHHLAFERLHQTCNKYSWDSFVNSNKMLQFTCTKLHIHEWCTWRCKNIITASLLSVLIWNIWEQVWYRFTIVCSPHSFCKHHGYIDTLKRKLTKCYIQELFDMLYALACDYILPAY